MSIQKYIRPEWNPITIAMMIIGFVIWWPLGFAAIAYIIWGDRFQSQLRSAEYGLNKAKRTFSGGSTGNAAFDAYRREELQRLQEERRRLDEELREFEAYMESLRVAKDQEEFERFKNDRAQSRTRSTSSRSKSSSSRRRKSAIDLGETGPATV